MTRRMRRWLKYVAFVMATFLGFVLVAGGYAWYQWNRVIITVRNDIPSNEAITEVHVSVRGDRDTVERVGPGEQRRFSLMPEVGESAIGLRYKLGQRECRWDGGYVEGSGGYRVVLEIRGCGDVRDEPRLWLARKP